jgi:hypothetical protein
MSYSLLAPAAATRLERARTFSAVQRDHLAENIGEKIQATRPSAQIVISVKKEQRQFRF